MIDEQTGIVYKASGFRDAVIDGLRRLGWPEPLLDSALPTSVQFQSTDAARFGGLPSLVTVDFGRYAGIEYQRAPSGEFGKITLRYDSSVESICSVINAIDRFRWVLDLPSHRVWLDAYEDHLQMFGIATAIRNEDGTTTIVDPATVFIRPLDRIVCRNCECPLDHKELSAYCTVCQGWIEKAVRPPMPGKITYVGDGSGITFRSGMRGPYPTAEAAKVALEVERANARFGVSLGTGPLDGVARMFSGGLTAGSMGAMSAERQRSEDEARGYVPMKPTKPEAAPEKPFVPRKFGEY